MSNRLPETLSEEWLRQQGRRHLERYWPSEEQLRRVLRRRVDRFTTERGGPRAPGYGLAEKIIKEFLEQGALNDVRFTKAWVESLDRRGDSRFRMRAKLRQKGVSSEVIDEVVQSHDQATRDEGIDPVMARAAATLKRRRLGPYRHDPQKRAERRDKDLGALARAGFPYGVCKQLIDAESIEDVELLASGELD